MSFSVYYDISFTWSQSAVWYSARGCWIYIYIVCTRPYMWTRKSARCIHAEAVKYILILCLLLDRFFVHPFLLYCECKVQKIYCNRKTINSRNPNWTRENSHARTIHECAIFPTFKVLRARENSEFARKLFLSFYISGESWANVFRSMCIWNCSPVFERN